jgi:hypothetical protein
MGLLLLMVVLPVFFAVTWLVLFMRDRGRGLALALVVCGMTITVGWWSILQSRSSTAAIGVLFLPGAGGLSGLLGLAFGRLRISPQPVVRALAWLCLFAGGGVTIAYGLGGIRERMMNRDRDRAEVESRRLMEENRRKIAELVRVDVRLSGAVLDAEIEKHRHDRTFLIPALETSSVSEDMLDRLSGDDDMGVVLMVARNSRTRSATLERIYRASRYPPYFFDALAENRNTPVTVLQDLAAHPAPMDPQLLDRTLARNPSVPRDMLNRIAGSSDVYALRNLLGNPALDCDLLRRAAERLGSVDRSNVSAATIGALRARLCQAK